MTRRRSKDGIYEFEKSPNMKGVWIRHLKEGRELYLFPDDIADLVRFLAEQRAIA